MRQIKFRAESPVIKDFKTVYEYRHNQYASVSENKIVITRQYHKALARLGSRFSLSREALLLLAELVKLYPSGSLPYSSIAEIAGIDSGKVVALTRSLRRRKLITFVMQATEVMTTELTSGAMILFLNSSYLTDDSDFINAIEDAGEEGIRSYSWFNDFEHTVLNRRDSAFSKEWIRFGIPELPLDDRRMFCLLLDHFIRNFTKPYGPDGSDTSKELSWETEGINANTEDMGNLVQKGLVIKVKAGHVLSPDVVEGFLKGRDNIVNYDEISSLVTIIKRKDLEKKELFFSKESQEEIDNLHRMLSPEGFDRVCSILTRKKRKPALQSLLWGGPGTGKTETVKQIALCSGRDILSFDISKVTASDWGATENLYRNLFRAYRYIVAVKSQAPILLLNEADQVLSKRLTSIERSIDKSENIVSNILLQEMEDMHGILMATTNFANILDEAFERRFLFKTELQKPDARAQARIWKSLIPELSNEECSQLSKEFDMSGAQISNVASKRDIAELYFEGDRGLAYIKNLCQKEISSERDVGRRPSKIGYTF